MRGNESCVRFRIPCEAETFSVWWFTQTITGFIFTAIISFVLDFSLTKLLFSFVAILSFVLSFSQSVVHVRESVILALWLKSYHNLERVPITPHYTMYINSSHKYACMYIMQVNCLKFPYTLPGSSDKQWEKIIRLTEMQHSLQCARAYEE